MLRLVPFADVWVPLHDAKSDAYRRELVGDFMGLFLLTRPAPTADAIRAEFQSRLARMQFPDRQGFNKISRSPRDAASTPWRACCSARAARADHGRRLLHRR